ncbi:hypothetical protein [Pseudoxanthomonas winnipegensis]|uniref:hypothetical protein n=1 Tax=Pseudoxanthomonas winnipegensis TaxID=2480810 RepID=UPI003F871803
MRKDVAATSLHRRWRRVLGIGAIAGSGAGLAVLAQQVASGQVTQLIAWLLLGLFAAAYGLGIVAGLALIEGWSIAPALGVAFWLPQALQVYSPLLSYQFWAPFNFSVWFDGSNVTVGFVCRLGAMFHLVLGGGGVWGAGLNLSAVAIVILLYTTARKDVARSPAPDGAPSTGS